MTLNQTPIGFTVPHTFGEVESTREVYEGLLKESPEATSQARHLIERQLSEAALLPNDLRDDPQQRMEWSQTRSAAVAREYDSYRQSRTLFLYMGVAMGAARNPFLEPLLSGHHFSWIYQEIDPEVFGEELLKPGYESVDCIAVLTASHMH
jgi:hypothetical protein